MKRSLSHWPQLYLVFRYISRFGRIPNIRTPKTFNEIILKKLIFDRDPMLITFADKLLARDYVCQQLGSEKYCPKLYGVYERAEDLLAMDHKKLPSPCVLKPNHGSGWHRVIRDWGAINQQQLRLEANGWLAQNYGRKFKEWAYLHIKPALLLEELLAQEPPIDYRFVCYHGQPQWIYARLISAGKEYLNIFDLNWNLLPVEYSLPTFPQPIARPEQLEEMLNISAKLAAKTDFLRVDLYNIGGRIVFGELTSYPNAGNLGFAPNFWDEIFGAFYYGHTGRSIS